MMAAPRPGEVVCHGVDGGRVDGGSRMTPRPRDASSRPASNCGFTSSTRSAPGRAEASSASATVRREMNDRSATTTSAGGSRLRGRGRSCAPAPRRARRRAAARAAGRTRRRRRRPRRLLAGAAQSVNPPVDAPASSTRRPLDVDAERLEAGIELLATAADEPRPVRPASSIGSPASTRRDAFVAGAPSTVTRPASISARARSRLGTRPLRTSSASSRRRGVGQASVVGGGASTVGAGVVGAGVVGAGSSAP